jgi:hypothetical protein
VTADNFARGSHERLERLGPESAEDLRAEFKNLSNVVPMEIMGPLLNYLKTEHGVRFDLGSDGSSAAERKLLGAFIVSSDCARPRWHPT